MCGLAGFLDRDRRLGEAALRAAVTAMSDSLRHRGPDGQGSWVDPAQGVALGHRRLAIVDLSPAGHQPMVSQDGRLVIAYNGEVYNFQELAAALRAAGTVFRGHSDTEVVLEACARWGVEATLKRLVGMFAIALWDRHEATLTLARDPLGIKPLYWMERGGLLLFGSELKALRAHPQGPDGIDRAALAAFLRHNYIPAPHSIHPGVAKLPPGHLLVKRAGRPAELAAFWDMRAAARAGQADRLPDDDDAAAVERMHALLRDSVRRQMVADVPLGAFLSGGIDSSTVVALMQAESPRPVKTFTIGFHDSAYDEARHARAVAAHLGTEHTELRVEPQHALAVIPRLPEWFDEPFADASQIPTCLVSEMTRRHVTVALSGDGGDEVFGGYNRYFWADSLWRRLGRLPRPARRGAARLIAALPPGQWDRLFRLVPGGLRPRQAGDKMHKLAGLLGLAAPDALYRRLISQWEAPDALVPGAVEPHGVVWDDTVAAEIPSFFERMQFLDTVTYLPDDILTKVDRASMAVSLEARVPLLDHRVVEQAWRLPLRMKNRDGTGKWLLRQVLYKYVPPALIERPKMGFGVPIDAWLRHELRDWAEDLLDEGGMRADGLLDPQPIRAKWAEHLSGRRNWQYPLWTVLMVQAWLRHQRETAAVRPAVALAG